MDQPQPVSRVLFVPVHKVMIQILSICQYCALSCPHDLESGVLSDTSMDHPCGRRIDAAVTAQRLSAWTPKGTLPPRTHLPAGDRRPHSPGGRGSWWGWGRWRPSGLSVDERKRGSPGSPSEMSLSLPGPRANLSLRGPRPLPQRLKCEMNLSEQFTTETTHPAQWT